MMLNDRTQSEYHMAFSYLNRLNNLFYSADDAAIKLDAHAWFHTLLALNRELITEAKEEEKKELERKMLLINSMLEKSMKAIQRSGIPNIPPDLYLELHTFEIILRNIMKSSGLLMKIRESPEFALK